MQIFAVGAVINPELWRQVVGYEGLYEVSSFGNVRSLLRRRLKKPQATADGYLRVQLCKHGRMKNHTIHRMVLKAFVGPSNGLQAAHLNGVRYDNRLENLQWESITGNQLHRWLHGTMRTVLTEAKVLEMRQLSSEGASYPDLAKKFGLNRSTVYSAVRGRTWAHLNASERSA